MLTENDSSSFEIENCIVYEDFYKRKELIYLYNYQKKLKYDSNSNDIIIGKMKDEASGIPIQELV